jgi:type VI secretion system protein ImpF
LRRFFFFGSFCPPLFALAMNSYSPSLLDKLMGEAGDLPGKAGASPRYGIEQVKDSVARDIEMLLNAHAVFSPEDLEAYPHASRSLLTLGLADLSAMSLASDRDRKRITDSIGRTLAEHDRRLTQVEVRVRESKAVVGGLTFSIRARLQLQPDSQPVIFDAVLQPGSHRYAVSKGDVRAAADLV